MGYDGEIKIRTRIDTGSATSQMTTLENRILKTADKIQKLREKMDTLKDAKIPTQEYQEVSDQIEKASREFDKLLEKQERMQAEGKDHGIQWERLNSQMDEAGNTIKYAQGELQDLVDTGRAFTLGNDSQEYADLGRQLEYAQNDMEALVRRHDELSARQQDNASGYDRMKASAARTFKSTGNIIKSTISRIDGFTKKLKEIVQRLLPSINKSSKKTNSLISTSFKNILKYGLGIRSLYALVNKLRAAAKEGFTNLYNGSKKFKAEIDSLKASALTLENTLAAAFSPIAEIAIPYIQKLIDYLTSLIDLVGQFIAAITGQKTYTRAVKQTTAALEDANAATNKQLSSLDNLNNMTSSSSSGSSTDTSDMFEEVPISKKATELAESVKDIASQLFNPIKTAWDDVGQYIMDSWKYALQEISDLAKAIGKDFLTVWNETETLEMLEAILHIVGDIGQIVGNLAHNFRLAWEENETGLHILENVRDIIKAVIDNIHSAAEATVEWSKELDFGPLLESIEKWTKSLIQVFDFLSGVLEDIWEEIILPLTKWAVEKGLPELIQAFTDFNNKVHWEEIRNNLKTLWEHIEPFMETIGEGLIKFIKDVGAALAKFLNSQAFKDFLEAVEKFVDSVDSEDVANGLKLLCEAIVGYKVIKTAVTGLTAAKSFINIWTAGKGATVASEMTMTAAGVETLSTALLNLSSITFTGAFISDLNELLNPDSQLNRNKTIGNLNAELVKLAVQLDVDDRYLKNLQGSAMDLDTQFQTGKISSSEYTDQLKELYKNTVVLPKVWEDACNGIQLTDDQMQSLSDTLGITKDEIQNLYDSVSTTSSNIAKTLDENGNVIELDLTDHTNKIDMQIDETTGKVTTNVQDANKTVLDDTTTTYDNVFTVIDDNGNEITVSLDNNTKQWGTDFTDMSKTAKTATSNTAKTTSINMGNVNSSLKRTETSLNTNKTAFGNWRDRIADIFTNLWSRLKGTINSILGGIEGMANGVVNGINTVIRAMNNLSFDIPDWVPSYGGKSFGFSIPEMNTVSIPRLAQGTVVPPNKEFMAILGDNKTEPEVVSPLSTMEQAVENVLSRMGSGGQQEITLNIPIELDGKVIFNLMRKYDREYFKSHGSPAFE